MKILIINGPNLNLLGTREPEIYGSITLESIKTFLEKEADRVNAEVGFFQSNIEGEIVEVIQRTKGVCDGIVINPAGYSYSSVAIRDAISAVQVPTVEVHISNIHAREEFRKNSIIAPVCVGQISGFGADSYKLGLISIVDYIKKKMFEKEDKKKL